MSQYTSSDTAAQGAVVNAVLDTDANTITYTVTTSRGLTATVTLPASQDPQKGVTVINDIRQQFAAQNGGSFLNLGIGGFGQSLNSTWGNVTQQAEKATATSEATGNPPPAEGSAIPVAPKDNPSPTPTPSEPPVENSTPATTTDPNTDPNTNVGDEAQVAPQVPVDDGTDPYVSNGNTTIDTIENYSPEAIGSEDPFEASRQAAQDRYDALDAQAATDAINASNREGLTTQSNVTRSAATAQDVSNFKQKEDWRVRLSLAPSATYLYKETDKEKRGILDPLNATDGVIFPYTPGISVQYAAHYDQTELTHSNYKYFQYKSSSVDQISITCDFTAQDTSEARYLLAVIHFFRSVTKMFYGQDNGPKPGTPPPLCYLSGLGAFQFDAHPLAITGFTYTLPTDVDYIRAGSVSAEAGVNQSKSNNPVNSSSATNSRLGQSNLNVGATTGSPNWSYSASSEKPTYVPTKMQMQITAVPIVTRYDISNKFSLAKYGTGQLLQGTQRAGGGIW